MDDVERTILALLAERSAGASICPSDVARRLDPERWRDQMDAVRSAARRLVDRGEAQITQRGTVVDPASARGPIRIRLPR